MLKLHKPNGKLLRAGRLPRRWPSRRSAIVMQSGRHAAGLARHQNNFDGKKPPSGCCCSAMASIVTPTGASWTGAILPQPKASPNALLLACGLAIALMARTVN
jgi:hypothetical protein